MKYIFKREECINMVKEKYTKNSQADTLKIRLLWKQRTER